MQNEAANIMSRKKKKSPSVPGRKNYQFKKPMLDALHKIIEQTGKSETTAISDLVLGQRLFPPEVEDYITEQQASNRAATRWQLIQEAVVVAMNKADGGSFPKRKAS